MIHQERLTAAMEKGIPLPEFPAGAGAQSTRFRS